MSAELQYESARTRRGVGIGYCLLIVADLMALFIACVLFRLDIAYDGYQALAALIFGPVVGIASALLCSTPGMIYADKRRADMNSWQAGILVTASILPPLVSGVGFIFRLFMPSGGGC